MQNEEFYMSAQRALLINSVINRMKKSKTFSPDILNHVKETKAKNDSPVFLHNASKPTLENVFCLVESKGKQIEVDLWIHNPPTTKEEFFDFACQLISDGMWSAHEIQWKVPENYSLEEAQILQWQVAEEYFRQVAALGNSEAQQYQENLKAIIKELENHLTAGTKEPVAPSKKLTEASSAVSNTVSSTLAGPSSLFPKANPIGSGTRTNPESGTSLKEEDEQHINWIGF